MWTTKLNTTAAVLVAAVAVTGRGLQAKQPLAPKATSPIAVAAAAKSRSAGSAAMAETEAKLARFRELVRPKAGEYVTNMAKIAWERDPWAAAVRAGKEGKPVIAYGPGMVGLPCGHG